MKNIDKKDRNTLKSFFLKNSTPTQSNFADLIDGMLNQKDDGIVKLPGDPLSIAATGDIAGPQKLINFYGNVSDNNPTWMLQLNPRSDQNTPGTAKAGFSISDGQGVSRLFIDKATGNIGIGTTEPTHKLHVVVDDGAVGLFESTSEQAFLRLSSKEGIGNRVEVTNRPGGRLSLWTSGGGDVFNVTKKGYVGIGTTEPTHKLHVVVDDGAVGLFQSTSEQAFLRLHSKEGIENRVEITNRPGGRLSLWTGGKDVFNITKEGNVGIGTTTPQAKLDIQGDLTVNDQKVYPKIYVGKDIEKNIGNWTVDYSGENFIDVYACFTIYQGHSATYQPYINFPQQEEFYVKLLSFDTKKASGVSHSSLGGRTTGSTVLFTLVVIGTK